MRELVFHNVSGIGVNLDIKIWLAASNNLNVVVRWTRVDENDKDEEERTSLFENDIFFKVH